MPKTLTNRFTVIVLADTELGTVEFLTAVRKRGWRAVVGMRSNRLMENGNPSNRFTVTPNGYNK